MIPFKGFSSLKQYLPLKPSKWGYKVYCLCGAPSAGKSVLFQFDKKQKSSPATKAILSAEVRTDGFNHFPIVVSRGRCKNPGCKAAPVYFCQKCKVHLCITKDKNCFLYFHTK